MNTENINTQILKVFANNPFDAFNPKQIASRVGARDKASRQLVRATMQQMAEDNILVEDQKERYKINPVHISDDLLPRNFVVGNIDMKQSGKAYVIPQEEGREDIQIAPNNTNHALHGDLVKVLMFPKRKMHRPEGQVVEILHRSKTRFVGCIQMQERFAFMVSDSRSMVVDIFIPLNELGGAEDGEKVLVEMTDWPERMNNPVGRVIKRLGRPGDNNVEMQSILAEYNFPLDYPAEALAEADKMQNPTEADYKKRRDFRDVVTFTIDPSDAKDFDDALSFRRLENGTFEVGVHIADVSHYVQPGSAIDREAYDRATSVYLVDRTVSMLPERLSNDLCSLRPNEDKLCFSVVLQINEKAEVLSQWFGKTVINSNRRFSYDEAQSIIESMPNLPDSKPETTAVAELYKLSSLLRSERMKNGAINFDTQEVKFILDENVKPIGVYIKEQKEANWLIEEFMLLANKKVAEYVGATHPANGGKPHANKNAKTFVYRIHDEPNPEKLNNFVDFIGKLGYKMRLDSRKNLTDSYNQLFQQISGRGEETMINNIAIRTMSKALYSTENIGHYGLGFPFYTHFTSPIRRYPDLMVHRLLQRYLDGGASVSATEYEDYCQHCSQMEKRAADAERESIKYKQAEFLADKIGKVFPALITGVSKWGIYAELEDSRCEGMIPIGSLRDDYYMLDEDNYQVIGRRYGKCYKLGYPITVRVKRVDMLKKQIDYELVEDEPAATPDANSKKKDVKAKPDNKKAKSTPKSAKTDRKKSKSDNTKTKKSANKPRPSRKRTPSPKA